MSDGNERDQGEIGSNAPYPPSAPSQYPHPQSSYAYPASDYPPISDHDLAIAGQGYPPPLQQQIAAQLQDATAQAARANNGEGMRINTNGSSGLAGMSPPQPQVAQGFSPAAPRSSVDATPNSATPADQKGRRGKASQACDECRRKKTKCITGTDEHGVPTTCNSCAKAGIDCTYSRQPMKRGPNKGYIKELADRVQHVENLLPSYRQSFDVDMFGGPGDEQTLARRNYSLPGGGRASFSGPDFGRDRLGSFGSFAHATSQPSRNRDRFSIAVPPDQSLPAAPTTTSATNVYDEVDLRPAKRVKMDAENTSLPAISVEDTDLAKYYEMVHPHLAILPDAADSAIKIISKATPDLQHAIVTAVSLFPNTATSQENDHMQKSGIRDMKDMATRLNDVYNDEMNSAADALVFVWTAMLLVVHAEYTVDVFNVGPLATPSLVRKYLDLLYRLAESKSPTALITVEKSQELGLDMPMLQAAAIRTRCMAMVQSKLTLLATGRLIPNVDDVAGASKEDVAAADIISLPARFLAYASKSLVSMAILVNVRFEMGAKSGLREAITDQIELSVHRTSKDTSDPLAQQLDEFISLILARSTRSPLPIQCIFPAAKLAEMLTTTSSTYSPLDAHLYTVCAFTFLEVLSTPSANNDWASSLALTGLNSIRPILEQKAAEHAASRSAAEKAFWGTQNGKEVIKKSWAEALSIHIDACDEVNWVNSSITTRHYTETGRPDITANFGQLIDLGYLTVLAYYARNMVRNEMEEETRDGLETETA